MICVSKADEGTFRHLSYNQSPQPLAANQTTRQDLNGISNLREHVAADQDDDAGGGTLGSASSDEKWLHQGPSPGSGDGVTLAPGTGLISSIGSGAGAGLPLRPRGQLYLHPKADAGGDDQFCLSSVISPACLSRIWGWITWTASVLLSSFVLSALMNRYYGYVPASSIAAEITQQSADHPVAATIPDISTDSPIRPLRKRASSCTAGGVASAEYNTTLHVGALLIVWFVSTLSCVFPILAKRFPGLRIPQRFFFAVRHFGTGVLLATAFVHLFPTAFISLGDPCLGDFWTSEYDAMPGAIALAAIFFVTIVEMVFHPSRRCSPDLVDPETNVEVDSAEEPDQQRATTGGVISAPMCDMAPPRARSSSVGHRLNRLSTMDEEEARRAAQTGDVEAKPEPDEVAVDRVRSPSISSPEMKLRKERLQVILLELGILFHSVFIGMALSVSVGNEFVILLIAIVFHQTFEGLALGARISMVKWPESKAKWQPWLMAAAFGFTTPIGQAIGIATHSLYSPDSEVGLIVVGVMNAISAGLLTFASLVELMSEDFLSDESWTYLRGRKRVVACLLVFLGAFCMSLVGAWA